MENNNKANEALEGTDDEGGAGLQHTTNNNNKADGRRWSWAQHTTNNNNKDG